METVLNLWLIVKATWGIGVVLLVIFYAAAITEMGFFLRGSCKWEAERPLGRTGSRSAGLTASPWASGPPANTNGPEGPPSERNAA